MIHCHDFHGSKQASLRNNGKGDANENSRKLFSKDIELAKQFELSPLIE
jgi:hypothetical protein